MLSKPFIGFKGYLGKKGFPILFTQDADMETKYRFHFQYFFSE